MTENHSNHRARQPDVPDGWSLRRQHSKNLPAGEKFAILQAKFAKRTNF
jgi:hypothetical protein